MSKSPILSVAALLVAGLAICLQLLGTGESAPAPAPVSRGLEPAAELLARLDEIHASQLRLEERVSMLEVRDGGSRLPASVASQEELEELYFDRDVDEDAFIETGNEMLDGVAAFWNGLDEQRRRIAAI